MDFTLNRGMPGGMPQLPPALPNLLLFAGACIVLFGLLLLWNEWLLRYLVAGVFLAIGGLLRSGEQHLALAADAPVVGHCRTGRGGLDVQAAPRPPQRGANASLRRSPPTDYAPGTGNPGGPRLFHTRVLYLPVYPQ